MKRLYIVIALFIFAITAYAHPVLDLPTTNLNGHIYYYYDVKPGDTLFSLSKKIGLSIEEIKAANPSSADGLQAYSRLYFPADPAPVQAAETSLTHKVAKGETLYGISKKYDMTVDELLALNPSARDGIRSGDVLKVRAKASATTPTTAAEPVADNKPVENPATVGGENTHTSPRDRSLPQSAPEVQSTTRFAPDSVTDLNRFLQESSRHTLAQSDAMKDTEGKANKEIKEGQLSSATPGALQLSKAHSNASYDIVIMLPFKLYEVNPSTGAQHFTDFYRGFLLGAEQHSADSPKINIRAVDTAASLDTVKMLMGRPEIRNAQIIIGPESEEQFDYIVSQVDPEKTYVVNTFANRSDAHSKNKNVIQTNIPRDEMYARAAKAFADQLGDRTPVFISRRRGSGDKGEFVDLLKADLKAANREFVEIAFDDVLGDEDLESLSITNEYVFIPVTGSKQEFMKFAGALKHFKQSGKVDNRTAIFGYPEWLLFRGDLAESLNTLDAVIYSRFYVDQYNAQARQVTAQFEAAFCRQMIETVPSQALLGYDTATFLINALKANKGDFHIYTGAYNGLQTDFDLIDDVAPGIVNNSLKLIRFSTGHQPQVSNI